MTAIKAFSLIVVWNSVRPLGVFIISRRYSANMCLFYVFKRVCGDKIESREGESRPEKIAEDGPAPEVCFFWPGAAVNSGGAGGKWCGVECVILHKDTPKIYHICMRTTDTC